MNVTVFVLKFFVICGFLRLVFRNVMVLYFYLVLNT